MLEQVVGFLKNLNTDRPNLEELVMLHTFAKLYRAEFDHVQVEAPAWLDETVRKLRREITARNSDAMANAVRQIDAELDRLKTPSERKAELMAKREKLTGATA